MNGLTGSEKVVYTTCAGAFFGAAIGSVESVWAIPKLGAKLPKLSAQLKHLGTRSFVFAAVGCIFSTGEYLSASIRQTEDSNQRRRAAMCAASFWQSSQETPFEKYGAAHHADYS
ncbi:unnamed protein product [Peronospora destructor]|uniref:Uncharacterized protein n=1 Tax=Peronospora destructor TaxID=86335 RepID=A0AAV0V1R0_9STRA|nr:unnamed protein product [Peronospora destructor]